METTKENQHEEKTIWGKRKSKRLEIQRIKRQNLENHDQLTEETKITDVNFDCLEHIFMYLDLKDLLNVADSNKYLRSVSECTLVREYKFGSHLYISMEPAITISDLYSEFSFLDVKTCFQFVRYLGHLIRNMNIKADPKIVPTLSSVHECFLNYLNEYCINVWEINIREITILNKFQKPFSKVQHVYLKYCSLGPNSIDWLFPNINSLRYNSKGNIMDIDKPMPKLMELTIEVSHGRLIDSCKKSIETACRLNPQLKYFEVYLWSGLNMQLFANLSKYLQSVARLKINVMSKEELSYEGDTIHFKSLNEFEINVYLGADELFPKIPFSFDRLKSLRMFAICEYSDEFFKFVSKCPTIDTLSLGTRSLYNMYISNENIKKIASVLPALETIDFNGGCSFGEVCHYLTEFKLLNRFHFGLIEKNNLNDLRARFGNEWKILESRFGYSFEMERIK